MDPQSGPEPRGIRTDALYVILITLITALPYVARLGFYSDDWYVLWTFHADTIQHNFGIHSALRDRYDRPLQGLYLALLYLLFGLHPLGYHLVNVAVIAAALALFYWLLVRMKVDRATAIGTAVVLLTLPQLSTIRVWYLTFQISLSMLAAWVSLHCQLSFSRNGKIAWAVAAALAGAASIAAYEIFAPLIAAFPIGLLALRWRNAREHRLKRTDIALIALVFLVGPLVIVKYAISDRPPAPQLMRYMKGLIQLVRPDYDWRTDYSLNIFAALDVHFWWPVLGWARGVEALVNGALGWAAAAAVVAAALLAFWRIRSVGTPLAQPWSNGRLLLLGAAAFVLGHAAFVIAPSVFFSPTGMANRALVAGAVGVALIFVAAVRYASSLAYNARRPFVFSATISIIVFLGTLRVLQIANYWAEAPAVDERILAAARSDLKNLPAQSTVMLDNVCPYDGPAVIFEAPWDVSGALSLAAGKPVHGDAVSARMSLQRNGLVTSIYGDRSFYPYGRDLYVYDPARHRIAQLRDFGAALRYFAEAKATRTRCPRGYVGHGVLI